MKRRPWRQTALDWLVYCAVRVALCVVQALSLDFCAWLADWLAWLAADVLRIRGQVVEENLQTAFPRADLPARKSITRRMWRHLFLMVFELAHAPRKLHRTTWRNHVTLENQRAFVSYMLDQRARVVVSGHFGNFELASYLSGLFGFPSFSIARELDNPFLHRFITRFRSLNGQYMLPKDGSAARVQAVLENRGAIALLADQHAGDKGCWVDFLGRPASCHKAVALFTLTGGAPMLVCYARRIGGPLRYALGMQAACDPHALPEELAGVKQLTQWYNRRMEELIRAHPEQYWWLHRRWKEPAKKRQRKPSDEKRAAA